MTKLPTLYIPHGWWPWNLMWNPFGNSEDFEKLKEYLKNIWKENNKNEVKHILIFSAHWEEKMPTIYSPLKPKLYYDYYWFPKNTYNIDYQIKWNTQMISKIEQLLNRNNFITKIEYNRWYDHWVFIPLMLAFPDWEIPVTQISLLSSLDPNSHIQLWKSLEKLRSEWVLIIWSGMSYHNMNWFLSNDNKINSISKKFNKWLSKILLTDDIQDRNNWLINWKDIDWSLNCHPRSEHLTPLFVIAWAWWNDKCKIDYLEKLMNVEILWCSFW